ncbi:hypothetical protein NBZ79_12080 [Sneathiella marina]|uniref:Amino acid permease n=1 Tax=Sneathiella marina TaxID=2950108 RepID=A0ABY4W3P1_9PROT|nr:hypothetical protein [Sneathiella marina]USG59914.1 hypothetical protein NBZ79_12080 [Sneathiella marina]
MTSRLRDFAHGTTTPLASIFGSGFLVIVAVLADSVGPYALPAMAGICLVAYGVGAIIRFNIRHAEPVLDAGNATGLTSIFERIADIALVPAYIISVTLYIRILASYGLGFLGSNTEYNQRALTTAIILFILFIGVTKGLRVLEGLERWALITTMAIIALMIAAFFVHDMGVLVTGELTLPDLTDPSLWQIVTVLGGTLIVVQGFETTRYLGDEFDAPTRIKASRNAQFLSTGVYILFVALATPIMYTLPDDVADNALMDLAGTVAVWLPLPLVIAAIFSQFSAATADTIGASGNMLEFTRHRIPVRLTYLIICGFAVLLTWSADTFEILTLASRAFAFYYFMQCLVAFSVAQTNKQRILFLLAAAGLLFITIFAVPVG